MRNRAWLAAAFLLAFVLGAGACRKYVTEPIYRLPVISSVVAFPTVLGQGDSTMITIFASDPNGDPLVYDWEPFNGLKIKGSTDEVDNYRYGTTSPSMVFYSPTIWPYPTDTAFVECSVRDGMGGSDHRIVLILYRN